MSEPDLFLSTLQEWMGTALQRSMHAFIRRIREGARSLSQVNSLFRLYHHGPSSVNDLAEHLGITMAAVSQLLDPLVKNGLVLRTEDPEDRRAKLIALTDIGRSTVEEGMRARHAWLADLAGRLTPDEKATLQPALELLNQHTRALLEDSRKSCTHPAESAQNRDPQAQKDITGDHNQ